MDRIDLRSKVLELGPPLYVPGGRFGERWRARGHGSDSNGVTSVVVSSDSVEVRTSSRAGDSQPFALVFSVVISLISPDISFPFTVTIDERPDTIVVDGDPVPVTVIDSGRAWAATCQIGGRWVVVSARDVPIADVSLTRVDDLAGLPDDRYRQH